MIFYFAGFIGLILLLILFMIRALKKKKIFNILNISILVIALVSIGIGIKSSIDDKSNSNQQKNPTATVQNQSIDSKDITEVDPNTLIEPKTENEQALALGYYKYYSEELINQLKKQQTKEYPKFGELKNEIPMIGLSVDFGTYKSILKLQKNVINNTDKNHLNSLIKDPDKVFGYDKSKTIYNFDSNNQLYNTLTRLGKSENNSENSIEQFKKIRQILIKEYGQPTFENAFLTPKDKFDESQDKNITYVLTWVSNKKVATLLLDKKEKSDLNSKVSLSYDLRN